MKTITVSSVEKDVLGYVPAFIVDEGEQDYLVGRICTIVETMGLSESQERAARDLLRQEVYKVFSYERGCRFLEERFSSVIRTMFNRREDAMKGLPPGTIRNSGGEYELTFVVPQE